MKKMTKGEKIAFFGSGILASLKTVKEYSSYIEELRDEIHKTIENTDSRRHFEGELMKTIDKRDRAYKIIGCLVEDIHDLENGNER